MIQSFMRTLTVVLAVFGGAVAAQPTTTSAPASQPGETVLVRIGTEATVTQYRFQRAMVAYPERDFDRMKDTVVRNLVNDELVGLYYKEHPDLLEEGELDRLIKESMERAGIKSEAEAVERLKQRDMTWPEYRRWRLLNLVLTRIMGRAEKEAQDPEKRRAAWDADPTAFDNTRVEARHIMVVTRPYDTPEQLRAKREKLENILADLNAGRRSWEEVVPESEDLPSRSRGGSLGMFTRHGQIAEPLSAAAFKMMVGERSGVIESELGYHILEVMQRVPGNRPFSHQDTEREMKFWFQRAAFLKALDEMRAKHPVVGVRPPTRFAYPPPVPDTRPVLQMPNMTGNRPRPATQRAVTTAPARATRPARTIAPARRPATRPAAAK